MKKFGIYLCYPPTVDLRMEGLGRQLGEFIKGAQERDDVSFVIACPSWLTENLDQLFESCNLPPGAIELIAPHSSPLLLTLYRKYLAYLSRKPSPRRKPSLRKRVWQFIVDCRTQVERRLAITRNLFTAMFWGSLLFAFLFTGATLKLMWALPIDVHSIITRVYGKLMRRILPARLATPQVAPRSRQGESEASRLFRLMEEYEATLMGKLIDARKDVIAWFSPTAFWPSFNEIAAPRLICVPDVVLTEFPAGFAAVSGFGMRHNFNKVEKAIRQGEYFVTYSEHTKWETLVRRYGVHPQSVYVVRHGANRLDELIRVSGFPDNDAATEKLCRNLLLSAMQKDLHRGYSGFSINTGIGFLFYASQFRPSKNILSLLRAYDYLLKRRFIGHKLILTGNPRELDDVMAFIEKKNLQNDVLCLHGLSEQELAACYRLADLAVNPSLSEGGCPFTFTESLSVGTPVVMARIPVTEEVITEPKLQELMLFDPYDWTDMAHKIEWGLHNRDLLLARQKPFYDRFAQRSWRNVVDEYVAILDLISSQREATSWAHAKVC
jgi:glycosyltransferase involved in cell wall biosynthesis